jgi:Tfp pilus assembly protein PilX
MSDDIRYDKSYLAEKAESAKRSAEEILNSLERPNSKASRSYIISGCLGLESALSALHAKARQVMEQCGETESDYALRPLGKVVRGEE